MHSLESYRVVIVDKSDLTLSCLELRPAAPGSQKHISLSALTRELGSAYDLPRGWTFIAALDPAPSDLAVQARLNLSCAPRLCGDSGGPKSCKPQHSCGLATCKLPALDITEHCA